MPNNVVFIIHRTLGGSFVCQNWWKSNQSLYFGVKYSTHCANIDVPKLPQVCILRQRVYQVFDYTTGIIVPIYIQT